MPQRVLIVGGGSGGTILANLLSRRRFEVTVVSASREHLFQPGLLYAAFTNAGSSLTRDERTLLRHARLVHGTVTHIDLSRRLVTTGTGERLGYDVVVLATGIRTDPAQIPGLAEINAQFGDYHSGLAQARRLRASLDAFRGGTIVLGQSTPICKCPPSPVEGILLADELLRKRGLRDKTRLVFFTPYPRPYPAEPMSQIVEPVLRDRGIEVRTFFDVDRIDPATSTIYSIEGEEIRYDLPIIIPPFVGADIAYEPADVIDESRFLLTDRLTLKVKGTDAAFAIGDGTNLPTSKAGVGAHLEAKTVARTLAGHPATFSGRTHCPFDFGYRRATFVTGSYEAPVVKSPPTRLKHLMKMTFGHIYWVSVRGELEPMFDLYFQFTDPERAQRGGKPHRDPGQAAGSSAISKTGPR